MSGCSAGSNLPARALRRRDACCPQLVINVAAGMGRQVARVAPQVAPHAQVVGQVCSTSGQASRCRRGATRARLVLPVSCPSQPWFMGTTHPNCCTSMLAVSPGMTTADEKDSNVIGPR